MSGCATGANRSHLQGLGRLLLLGTATLLDRGTAALYTDEVAEETAIAQLLPATFRDELGALVLSQAVDPQLKYVMRCTSKIACQQ